MHDDERALSWSSLSILVDHKRTNMPDGARDSMSMSSLTTNTGGAYPTARNGGTHAEAQNSMYID